jgi:hypothetical protein
MDGSAAKIRNKSYLQTRIFPKRIVYKKYCRMNGEIFAVNSGKNMYVRVTGTGAERKS